MCYSCTKKNPKVEFINNTAIDIDSINLITSKLCPKLMFKNVKSNSKFEGNLMFCKELKWDGTYGIEIYKNGKVYDQRGFGYYSNGVSLNRGFIITYREKGYIVVKEY